ncbi:ABC transporter substrate-binding protein [Actinokineospora sp.]|uniref:ABC transporter substrate-binding protein n=1 Tax=Actinokineospora sp. TaxID=1872133 RepID=UPI004037E4C5
MLRRVTAKRVARVRLPIAILAMTTLATLSGCGLLGGDDGESSSAQSSASAGLEKTKIKVGVLPIVDVAPFHWAVEQGYFKAEGLDVEPVVMPNNTATVNGIVNGDLDVAYSSYPVPLLLQSKKVADFKILSDALSGKPGHAAVVAPPNSPLKKPADMPGKRIALVSRNSMAEFAPRAVLRTQGVEFFDSTLIEMPFPEMIPAMERGDVDGAVVVEPWVTTAMKRLGAVPVFDVTSGPTADMPLSGYFAVAGPGKFATTSPKTILAFQRALAKAQADGADRAKMEQMFVKHAKIDQQTANLVTLSNYPTSLEPIRIQRVANLMAEFGALKDPLDVRTMIFNAGNAGK